MEDHSDYDYTRIAQHASLVVDIRNATRGMHSDNLCLVRGPFQRDLAVL